MCLYYALFGWHVVSVAYCYHVTTKGMGYNPGGRVLYRWVILIGESHSWLTATKRAEEWLFLTQETFCLRPGASS